MDAPPGVPMDPPMGAVAAAAPCAALAASPALEALAAPESSAIPESFPALEVSPALVVARSLHGLVRAARLPDTLALLPADVADCPPPDAAATGAASGAMPGPVVVPPASGPVLGVVRPRDGAGRTAGDDAIAARLLPEALRDGAVFRFAPGDERALLDWCWRRLSLWLGHAMQGFARGQLALAAARAHEQDLVRALEQVEAAYEHFRMEPGKLALSLAPSGVYLGLAAARPVAPVIEPVSESGSGSGSEAGPPPVVVRQRIGARLVNVTQVDLFFPRDGAGLSGALELNVAGAWSRAPLCACRVAFAAIRAGWNRFWCAAPDPRAGEPLELTLLLSGRDAPELLPGLAAPSPIAAECAATDGAPAARPLALRVWCGIPGLRQPRRFGAHGHPPDHSPAGLAADFQGTDFRGTDFRGAESRGIELALPAEMLAQARQHALAAIDLDFAPLAHDAASQSLLVHPLGTAPTVARLPRLEVAGLAALSVLVSLRHPEAQPTEFAIQVVEAKARPSAAARAEPPRWLLLRAGEWGELRLDLPRPLDGPVDILLMTRNPTENFQMSWAYFRGLRLWRDAAPGP